MISGIGVGKQKQQNTYLIMTNTKNDNSDLIVCELQRRLHDMNMQNLHLQEQVRRLEEALNKNKQKKEDA